jgi:hypothetical protein
MRWALIAMTLIGGGTAWALTPPQRAVIMGAQIINSGGGGAGGNCIEYQANGCILYSAGSSNSILVQ